MPQTQDAAVLVSRQHLIFLTPPEPGPAAEVERLDARAWLVLTPSDQGLRGSADRQ